MVSLSCVILHLFFNTQHGIQFATCSGTCTFALACTCVLFLNFSIPFTFFSTFPFILLSLFPRKPKLEITMFPTDKQQSINKVISRVETGNNLEIYQHSLCVTENRGNTIVLCAVVHVLLVLSCSKQVSFSVLGHEISGVRKRVFLYFLLDRIKLKHLVVQSDKFYWGFTGALLAQ